MPWLQPDQSQYPPHVAIRPTHLLEYNSYYAISYGPALFLNLPGPPRNPLKGHHLVVPATTRSFPSSVAVLVAPFELQPAPSTLQHKPPYTKTYPKTYFDPGLTVAAPSAQNEQGSPDSSRKVCTLSITILLPLLAIPLAEDK
ncbi:hypothetical protein GG344DRAFT_80207 [Lentinula edodes]|nr:hypothetical protein GG344DRAFT_80207 [Lentinula edodes]